MQNILKSPRNGAQKKRFEEKIMFKFFIVLTQEIRYETIVFLT